MRKFLLSFIITLLCGLNAISGNLNKWTNFNFQGVWEIVSTNIDASLNWFVDGVLDDIGHETVIKIELAFDYKGWGYLKYYTPDGLWMNYVRGRLFIAHPDTGADCLAFFCTQGTSNLVGGLLTFNVYACDNDPSDRDHFEIYPVNGAMGSARATRISTYYIDDTNGIAEVIECAMQLKFHDNGISVVDAEGSPVAVYGIDGTLHYQTEFYKGETIRLDKDACYIIKAGDNSMKLTF